MGTTEPVLVDSGGGFPFLPLLIFILIGIAGVSAWLMWMFIKYRNKGATDVVKVPPRAAAAPGVETYLLGIRRTPAGEWEIRVNGQRYRTLDAVPDGQAQREVVAALKALVTFSRDYIQKEKARAQPTQPEAPASTSQPTAPVPPPATAAPAAPSARATSQPASSMPRLRLNDEPALRRSSAPPTLMPTIDLAQEIGDIVEQMQTLTPNLRDRSIKLRNAASGGVEFTLDGIVYGSLDELPDPDVKALIQAAIKEWERQ